MRAIRTHERKNSAHTMVSEEGVSGSSEDTGAEISWQPVMMTMVRQAVPLNSMEVHSGAGLYPHPLKDHTPEQKDVLEGGCDPVESSHWSRLLIGPVTPWKEKPTLAQVSWQDL